MVGDPPNAWWLIHLIARQVDCESGRQAGSDRRETVCWTLQSSAAQDRLVSPSRRAASLHGFAQSYLGQARAVLRRGQTLPLCEQRWLTQEGMEGGGIERLGRRSEMLM